MVFQKKKNNGFSGGGNEEESIFKNFKVQDLLFLTYTSGFSIIQKKLVL